MISTICISTALALVLVALQTSALPAVMLSALLLLPLAALIAFLVRAGPRWSQVFAVTGGVMLDSVSPMPFGTHLIAFFVIVAVIVFLQERFFTNRSWPVIILLAGMASALYGIVLWVAGRLTAMMHGTLYTTPLAWTAVVQIPVTILCVVLFILLGAMVRAFFGSAFLLRSSRPEVR